MTDTEIAVIRHNLETREIKRRAELMKLHGLACGDFEKITAMIVRSYNPAKIYQWGSLLEPELFTAHSDIDIAVEGFAGPLDVLHALADAEEITDFPVDLVELEHIHPANAETIRARGRLVYART